MTRWKSDPLYCRIFAEIACLWSELDPNRRPQALRIEEHFSIDWQDPSALSFLDAVWMYDDFGFRSVPGLRRETYEPGDSRGEFFRFGLVRFVVADDRSHVSLSYRLGPEIGGDIVYEIVGQDDGIELMALSGSVSRSL